jgi:branched-chain amino acid transport system substrate-binding protein
MTTERFIGLRTLAAAAFFALTGASALAQQITVGCQSSLSGPVSSLGIPQLKGIEAAYSIFGEIDGHQIRLVKLDDASDTSTAARNARKLVEEYKVDLLLGAGGTPLALAVANVAYEQKVPMIVLSPIDVPGPRGDWLVSVPQPPELMVAGDIEHMRTSGVKTVAYIGFNDAWGDLVHDALIKLATDAGITVVANERYARTDTSVTAQTLKIMAMHPDAVLEGGSGTAGSLPHIALAEQGFHGQQYATHAVIGPDFIRVGRAAVDGVIAPTGPVIVAEQLPASNPIRDVSLHYRAAYEKLNHEPANSAFAAYGYDGWLILVDAAKRALAKATPGTPEFRAALREALVTTHDVVGTEGVYNFRPGERYGVDQRARVMVKVEQGQWKLLP